MSRAFVREIDDAPPPPTPERPISAAPNLVTKRGASLIEAEIERLTRALPGLSGADEELAQRDLRYWENRRASMQIIERPPGDASVGFGAEVTLLRAGKQQVLRIVGEDEADPATGYLAWTAPLARALDEAEAGESVEFEAGGRTEDIEILKVTAIQGA